MTEAGASPANFAEIRAVLRWKDAAGNPHELNLQEGDTAQVGRVATNDLVLKDRCISRHHAVIKWRTGAFEIADLGSVNGTIVNGVQITQPQTLKDGDQIRLYETDIWFSWVEKETPKTTNSQPEELEMRCSRCDKPAQAICRFCGRAVCNNHIQKMNYIITVYVAPGQPPKSLVVADAVFCGLCKPQPEPIEMPYLA